MCLIRDINTTVYQRLELHIPREIQTGLDYLTPDTYAHTYKLTDISVNLPIK